MNIDIENKANGHHVNDWHVNSSPTTLPVETLREVCVDSLHHLDEMKIRTERSQYTFVLTDPTRLRGLLTGGQMGEEIAEAYMLAIKGSDDIRLLNDFSTIGEGMRIMFYIPAKESSLITSHIRMIFLVRSQ